MGEPNFDAYRRFTEITNPAPVEIIEGGKPGTRDDFIQVDYNGLRGLDKATTDRLMDKFAQVAGDGRIVAEGDAPALDTPQKAREIFEAQVYLAQMDIGLLENDGGGVSMQSSKIVYMDPKTASLADHTKSYIGSSISANPENDEKLYDQYMREHETAHQILGLKEAGADYIASARLMQTHPGAETQDFLQRIADLRTIAPFRVIGNNVGIMMINYGYGCSAAIEGAIHAPKDDIQKMTPEEMYENAHDFDVMNGAVKRDVGNVRPEMTVRNALLEINPDMIREDKYMDAKITSASQKLLDSGRFEMGTQEQHILEDLNSASKRMDAVVAQTTKAEPALLPSMKMAPSLASPQQP